LTTDFSEDNLLSAISNIPPTNITARLKKIPLKIGAGASRNGYKIAMGTR
jgi:hypothetical protein